MHCRAHARPRSSRDRRRSIWPIWLAKASILLALGCDGDRSSTFPTTGSTATGSSGQGGTAPSATSGSGGSIDFSAASSGGSTATGGSGGGQPEAACGDGKLDPGESCDDGNGVSGDGCAANCDAVEKDYACPLPGQPCVLTVVCGDGLIGGSETCDDQNIQAGDGCDSTCQVEAGYKCINVGAACEAAMCGDGIVAGNEECEDDNAPPASGDGCSATCQLEPGYICPTPKQACTPTTCGDGKVEGSEQCDDANNDLGDGCTPYCINEPDCSMSPAMPCTTSCGDGIKLPGGTEACEDGNTKNGDGCSSTCTIEPGYACTDNSSVPSTLQLPLVLRDFKQSHPDMENYLGVDKGIVAATLGSNNKPVYAATSGSTPTTTNKASFDQWYNDVPGTNITLLQTVALTKQANGTYLFSDTSFFPLNGLGWGNEGNLHNYHFTSEVRYWFEYKGGETLTFTGDDDVFVFVNKQLAVDLGGVHGAQTASVTLNNNFNLVLGKIYEIVVFQAERHLVGSNYTLTLGNFLNAASSCGPVCGDGIKTPDEVCDDGINDGAYGNCTADCKRGPFCGDGIVQSMHEECDDGFNLSPYGGCAPGCKKGGFCGDGIVDSLFGEQCDDGLNDGGYGECAPGCVLGPRCGDGVVQSNVEECDDGNKVSFDGCSPNCKLEKTR